MKPAWQKSAKSLGDKFETKVILTVEKHRHKAEITISPRNGPLVGLAQANDMTSAISEAFEHLQKQAVKYKTRWRSKKRHAQKNHEKKWNGKDAPEEMQRRPVGLTDTDRSSGRGAQDFRPSPGLPRFTWFTRMMPSPCVP